MTTRRVFAILLAGLCATGIAYAWIAVPRVDPGAGVAIAVLPNNDFIAALRIIAGLSGGSSFDLGVARVNADTGETAWLIDPSVPGFEEPLGAVTDTSGDLVVTGRGDGVNFLMKLSGSTGQQLWRTNVVGTWGAGYADMPVAFDSHHDVIVGGAVQNYGTGADSVVEKIDGATGEVLWRQEWNTSLFEYGKQVLVDPSGDVFFVVKRGVEFDLTIVVRRLSGIDGSEMWTQTIASPAPEADVSAVTGALDGSGQLVVVGIIQFFGSPHLAWFVAAVRDVDGALLWSRTVEGRGGRLEAQDRVWSVASANGAIYVVGALGSRSSDSELAVVALDDATGTERWRYLPKGNGIVWGDGRAVAVAADGSVVVTGSVGDNQGHQDMFVARLGASDGRPIWEKTPRLSAYPTRSLGTGIAFDSNGDIGVVGQLDHPQVVALAPSIVKLRFTDGAFGVARPPHWHRSKGTSEP